MGPLGRNFNENATGVIQQNNVENVVCKMTAIESRPQCVSKHPLPFQIEILCMMMQSL